MSTTPIQCEGHRRRGGAFTLGPVKWEQCPNMAVARVTVEQGGVRLEDSPACQKCIDEGKATTGVKHIKIARFPKPTAYKVGQVLFACFACEETKKIEFNEWHIRTIRGGKITAIEFDKTFTWVKLSTKHGDFGWAKNIPSFMRRNWRVGAEPMGLYTTKRKAARAEADSVKKGWNSDDDAVNAELLKKLSRYTGRKETMPKKPKGYDMP